mmetsp:Transcript_78688/g.230867  ORF Transcript_78688/g.230867 Transcript_78688/m.230867 type:complete len:313 (+) Transcript_78688:85-1023(+)
MELTRQGGRPPTSRASAQSLKSACCMGPWWPLPPFTSFPRQHWGLLGHSPQSDHLQPCLGQAFASILVLNCRRLAELELPAEGQASSASDCSAEGLQHVPSRLQPALEHLLLEHLLRQLALLRHGVGVGEEQGREAALVHLQAVRVHLLQPSLHLLEVAPEDVCAGQRRVDRGRQRRAGRAELVDPVLRGVQVLLAPGEDERVDQQSERLRGLLPLVHHAGEPVLCACGIAGAREGTDDGRVGLRCELNAGLKQSLRPKLDGGELAVRGAVTDEQREAFRVGLHSPFGHVLHQLLSSADVRGREVTSNGEVV